MTYPKLQRLGGGLNHPHSEVNMADKVKIEMDKDKGTIVEGADTGVGKILMAARKVKIAGREIRIKAK